jgi:hypothetical protein
MVPYPIWQLALLLVHMKDVEWTVGLISGRGASNARIEDDLASELSRRLSYCQKHAKYLELRGTQDRTELLIVRARLGLNYQQFKDEIRVLRETIEAELKHRRFAFIPSAKADRLDNIGREWAEVILRFPSAHDDIKSAVECYALDCNTACVFHSMRIAERGLRALAKYLKIKTIGSQNHPLEFAEWGGILSALRGRLNAVQQSSGRSAKKAASLKFHADAASQADYLNEIWRKEVSHARGMYNSSEALNALLRTRDFMSLLCHRLFESGRPRVL